MKNLPKVKVSVFCLTYNQKYIREALDSILMQDVNFEYEILINDDCSNDGTTEIIKEYQKNFQKLSSQFFIAQIIILRVREVLFLNI